MEEETKISPTLRDVARRAGVSVSTVSRTVSGSGVHPVALETQERIWAAVRALAYQPNDAAQRLVRGGAREAPRTRTRNVGLILGNVSYRFSDPYWAPVLDGVSAELVRQEYHLRFAFLVDDLKRRTHRALLSLEHIDGLILLGGVRPFGDAIPHGRIVVVEGGDQIRWDAHLSVDVVAMEKRRAMYALVDHLVGLGHRRLAFLGPSAALDERAEAFVHAVQRQELPYDPTLLAEASWSAEEAYPVARTLLQRHDEFDALVCGCDTIAIGAMRAAKERGLRLPDDLALTGFDDIQFARDLDPPLTTVHVPKEILGELAARRLIERIECPDAPVTIQVVPTSLVIRRSCGAMVSPDPVVMT